MSRLTRISLLLVVFFSLDKILSVARQVIIARQFGLSAELDAFNVANNLPDLLFALISGGALAIAFIPVLSDVLTQQGRQIAWELFSRIANLAFLVTFAMAIILAAFAAPLVRWELGVAPGFGFEQQALVVDLMRLNLIATLIFSISGLVMAGLQANQHFLLPAMAPSIYTIGQIFGALVLAPQEGYTLAGFTLPAFGLGVYGLVYGVILGAMFHLGIQIPGLIRFRFRWLPRLGIHTPDVRRVLALLGPRLLTVLFVQLIFLVRDNLASRLAEGAVTALTYGWMIQQVPQTLIGTTIGTAILPTLSEHFSRQDWQAFNQTVDRAIRVFIALTLPVAAVLAAGLRPLLVFAFGFDDAGTDLLLWVTRGFMVGLLGHCILEVSARSFYAQQDARKPLLAAGLNVGVYILLGGQLFRILGAPGISLTDSIAFTLQALVLFFLLFRRPEVSIHTGTTLRRALMGAVAAGAVTFAAQLALVTQPPVLGDMAGMVAGGLAMLPFVWSEIRVLVRL